MNTLSDSARKSLFPRGPSLGLKFLLFAALSIVMMIGDNHGDPRLQPVRAWTARALQPLLWAAALPHATLSLGDHFSNRETLLAENQMLQRKQLELQAQVLRMEALEAENARIRELLSSAAPLQTRVLIAEIVMVHQDAYRQIVLNKGERDGVYKGQSLVDASGIMGQVIEVNPASCVALLITGLDGSVPVEINRTGLQTIARGRGDGQSLSLPYLPGNADVKVGDLLVSSGLGGRFPSGYPVGKISELRHPAGESFMEGIAYPSARLDQGHQVLLVWAEQPPPAEAPVEHPAEHPAEHPSEAASRLDLPHPKAAPAVAPPAAAAAATPPAAVPAAPPATKPQAPRPVPRPASKPAVRPEAAPAAAPAAAPPPAPAAPVPP